MIISSIIEAVVSEGRLVSFLDADELQPDARTVIEAPADGQEPRKGDELITVTNGSFKWNSKVDQSTLSNINVSVKKGELVGVLGRVGDGKVSCEVSRRVPSRPKREVDPFSCSVRRPSSPPFSAR